MSTILVINPNSTQAVTDHISLALQPFRFEGGPQLDCQTLRSGPPGIESQAHVDSISDKLLRWLEENPSYRDVDAWVLACFSDPGLFAMREVLPCPVLGCAEASYHAASAMADKFGVISILARGSWRARRVSKYSTSWRALALSMAAGLRWASLASKPRRCITYLRTARPAPCCCS